MRQEVTKKILTIPNLLSLLRLLLLPVFFVLLVQYHNNVMAFIVILVASLTDLIDGFIARATHTVSELGQLLDPFVDRVFIILGVIAVFVAGRVPLWILILLLGRDACMLALTIYQKRRFNRDFEVIFLGKLTTALVMAGFCSLVLEWPLLSGIGVAEFSFLPGWGVAQAPLGIWLLYVGVIISWITGAIYLYRGTRPSRRERAAARQQELSRKNNSTQRETDALREEDAQPPSVSEERAPSVYPDSREAGA
ncbi:MAG: CDP-alcohol phosphatidyltransferase family protein [Coriobacteriales bacterium]|jgi:cardiolipin synthase|nr:CDP-alcohol phosphatidyltransferase family protein [Coriobacteriales bacterium]